MDVSQLFRSPENINKHLKTVGSQVVTTRSCQVCFPVSYETDSLAEIGAEHLSVGIFAIIMDNQYAVLSVNAMVEMMADEISVVDINNDKYYLLHFDAGSTLINNINLVKRDLITYLIYNQFISKGRVPWFMNYIDMCNLFSTALSFANANISHRPEDIHLMISIISRDSQDLTKFYRQVVKDKPKIEKPAYIPIKSVEYGSSSTLNKLGGAHFQKGVVSALIEPSDQVSHIEAILRK